MKSMDILKEVYLKSLFTESINEDLESDIKEVTPPIDDLTKENTTTIEEDTKDTKDTKKDTVEKENKEPEVKPKPEKEQETKVDVTITSEDGENVLDEGDSTDDSMDDEDGWSEEVNEKLSSVMEEGESLFYEIKNCTRGSFTDCKTKEELANYLREFAEQIIMAADEL